MTLPAEIFVFKDITVDDDDEPVEVEFFAAEKFADLIKMAAHGERLTIGTYRLVSEDTIINNRSR